MSQRQDNEHPLGSLADAGQIAKHHGYLLVPKEAGLSAETDGDGDGDSDELEEDEGTGEIPFLGVPGSSHFVSDPDFPGLDAAASHAALSGKDYMTAELQRRRDQAKKNARVPGSRRLHRL